MAKWFKAVVADEKGLDFLSRKRIQWQLNLSRAPWWGGHFERMVGIVKGSLYKTIGNGFLTWTEKKKQHTLYKALHHKKKKAGAALVRTITS